jgi:hypothetical protein
MPITTARGAAKTELSSTSQKSGRSTMNKKELIKAIEAANRRVTDRNR